MERTANKYSLASMLCISSIGSGLDKSTVDLIKNVVKLCTYRSQRDPVRPLGTYDPIQYYVQFTHRCDM